MLHAVRLAFNQAVVRNGVEGPILMLAHHTARELAVEAEPRMRSFPPSQSKPFFHRHEAEVWEQCLFLTALTRKFNLVAVLLVLHHAASAFGFAHAIVRVPEC